MNINYKLNIAAKWRQCLPVVCITDKEKNNEKTNYKTNHAKNFNLRADDARRWLGRRDKFNRAK